MTTMDTTIVPPPHVVEKAVTTPSHDSTALVLETMRELGASTEQVDRVRTVLTTDDPSEITNGHILVPAGGADDSDSA
jgi:hypothetical protein